MATDPRNEQEQILARIDRQWQGQHRPGSVDYSVWPRLEPALVAGLLDNATAAARHGAGRLLAELQDNPWRVLSADRGEGEGPRLTLQVKGRSVQLQCGGSPVLRVTSIAG